MSDIALVFIIKVLFTEIEIKLLSVIA